MAGSRVMATATARTALTYNADAAGCFQPRNSRPAAAEMAPKAHVRGRCGGVRT